MSHSESSNSLFQRYYAFITKAGKEPSLQTFCIDWFVKKVYFAAKIIHKCKIWVGITVHCVQTFFNISLKEDIVFVIYFEHLLVVRYLPHLLNFSVKAKILLILFQCIKAVC